MGKANNIAFNKTLKFRRYRDLIYRMCEMEGISITKYNVFEVKTYKCMGSDLRGANVIQYGNLYNFNYDNEYEVLEIPNQANKKELEGEFLVLIYNISLDYYILISLEYNINYDKSKHSLQLCDQAKYKYFGKYTISRDFKSITKETNYEYVDYGGNHNFDYRDVRKYAYNTSTRKIIDKLCGKKQYKPMTKTKSINHYKKKYYKKKDL